MKRCTNPDCNPSYLFPDDMTYCPFCHGVLEDAAKAGQGGGSSGRGSAAPMRPADRIRNQTQGYGSTGQGGQAANGSDFLVQHGRHVDCHGRILEVDSQMLFSSRHLKILNSLIRGEPYQLSPQTIEYTIRVESITGSTIPGDTADFILFGDYNGRLHTGDEVYIHAADHGNRRVVQSIRNETTKVPVTPGLQVPAAAIRIPVFILTALIILFFWELSWEIHHGPGIIINSFVSIIVVPLKLILGIIIFVFFIRILFGGGGRHHGLF